MRNINTVKDVERIEKTRDILLQHRGKNNAISAKSVGVALNLEENETNPVARWCVKKAIEMYKLPVIASRKGYFIINDNDELKTYMDKISRHMLAEQKRINLVAENALHWIDKN